MQLHNTRTCTYKLCGGAHSVRHARTQAVATTNEFSSI